MVLRQRRKPVSEIVTELDAFPKVPDTYVEYTLSGAYGKGSYQEKIVTFLWTLSVPPLAPPRVYGRLGGSFF